MFGGAYFDQYDPNFDQYLWENSCNLADYVKKYSFHYQITKTIASIMSDRTNSSISNGHIETKLMLESCERAIFNLI